RLERRVCPLVWYSWTEPGDDPVGVLAPGDGDGGGADRVFEHQVPADDPREVRVAEAGEGAADAGHDEGQDHRGAGAIGDRRRRAHEEAGPDDGADPQGYERHRAERPLERPLTRRRRFGHEAVDGFGPEQ